MCLYCRAAQLLAAFWVQHAMFWAHPAASQHVSIYSLCLLRGAGKGSPILLRSHFYKAWAVSPWGSPRCVSPPTQQPKLSLLCAHSRAQLYSSICRAQTAARRCAHSGDVHKEARAVRTDSRDLCNGSQHCWSRTQLDAHAAKATHSWILAGWSLSTARAMHSWILTQLAAVAPGCLDPQSAHFGTHLIFFLLHCHFPAWLCLLSAGLHHSRWPRSACCNVHRAPRQCHLTQDMITCSTYGLPPHSASPNRTCLQLSATPNTCP